MRPGLLQGLQARLMLAVLAGATLFALVVGGVAYLQAQVRALDSSRATLQGLARTIEKTAAVGAFARDPVMLRELMAGLASHPMVASATVVNQVGDVLATAAAGAAPGHVLSATDMSIVKPLLSPFDASETVGVMLIHANDVYIAADARRAAYRDAALMAGQAVLLAALLYTATARLVSRPIVRMAGQLHALVPGTDQRLEVLPRHTHDEIGLLVAGANALLDANAVALQRERALRAEIEAMEAQYRQIFDSSSAGIFVLDEQGCLINGNPTVSRVVGLTLEQMRGLQHDSFVQRVFGDPAQVDAMIRQARQLGETISRDLELVQYGEVRRWVHCLISVQPRMVEGVIYDITQRKRDEVAARHRAEHDPLTGLKNRAGCAATLDRLIADARAEGSSMSVLCIDLDGFKQINDRFGHAAGDQVLVACAERMKAAVRRHSDLVGRLGGDEFIVGLRGVGPADPLLAATAQALLRHLSRAIELDGGQQVFVGASIGVSCAPLHGSARSVLVHAADEALYHVKRFGKNAFAIACRPPPTGAL